MLNAIARQLRDTLVRRLPYNIDDPKMNVREWTYATFTRYLEMEKNECNAYAQLLDECIAHVQGGFPFNPQIDVTKPGDFNWIKYSGPEEAEHIRHRMLFEFVRADLLLFAESGEIHFADLESYRTLKQVIDEYDSCIEGGIRHRFFSRLDLEEHEHDYGYDLVTIAEDREIARKKLYAGKLTTRFAKVLFENEDKEMSFGEIYRLMKVTGKGQRRIPQWIDELGIDAGVSKGVYLKLNGDVLTFRSSYLQPRKQDS